MTRLDLQELVRHKQGLLTLRSSLLPTPQVNWVLKRDSTVPLSTYLFKSSLVHCFTLFRCFTVSFVSVSRKEMVKQDFTVNLPQIERGHDDRKLDNALNLPPLHRSSHLERISKCLRCVSPWEGGDGRSLWNLKRSGGEASTRLQCQITPNRKRWQKAWQYTQGTYVLTEAGLTKSSNCL